MAMRPPRGKEHEMSTRWSIWATRLIVVASITASCGGGRAATSTPPVKLTTYTSAVYPYSIGYPAGYSVEPAQRSMSEVDLPAEGPNPALDRFVAKGTGPVIAVGAQPVAGGTSVAAWVGATTERVHSISGYQASGSPQTIQVGGEPARLVTYPLAGSIFQLWAMVVHGDSGFYIVLRDDPGTEDADRALFDRILATLTFTS